MRRALAGLLRDERGFTLVEVLAAIVLTAIIVVPLTGLTVSNAKSAKLARAYLRASYLAQTRIEELRASAYYAIVAEPDMPVPGAAGFTRSVAVVDQPTVLERALGLQTRMKQVTVTVSWDKGARSIKLATLISGGQTP